MLDFLIKGTDTGNVVLTDEEKDLLEIFKKLSSTDKTRISERAETLAELAAERVNQERAAEQHKNTVQIAAPAADEQLEPEDNEPEQKEDFYIDLCSLPASAGSGVQLDEGFTEPMQIKPLRLRSVPTTPFASPEQHGGHILRR